MSYRSSVPDSDQSTPWYYSRQSYPVKTHKSTYFDLAHSAIVTRKLGQVKPFWVKAMDWTEPKVRWIYRNRRWLKYYINPLPFSSNAQILPKKTFSRKKPRNNRRFVQEGYSVRSRKRRCKCSSKFCYCNRNRFYYKRPNKQYRRKRTYRKYHQVY